MKIQSAERRLEVREAFRFSAHDRLGRACLVAFLAGSHRGTRLRGMLHSLLPET